MATELDKDSPIKRISRVRIFEQAVSQINSLIESGVFVTGQKLPSEQELSKQLNVSRASVREALRVLEAQGVIEIKRGLGAFISPQTAKVQKRNDLAQWLIAREEMLEQVLQVRESVEGLTASLTATRASAEDLNHIAEILEEQSFHVHKTAQNSEDFDELSRLDVEFHMAISLASGNDIANDIIGHILLAFSEPNKAVLYVSEQVTPMLFEHRAIYKALASRDPLMAEQAMRMHISRVKKDILSIKNL